MGGGCGRSRARGRLLRTPLVHWCGRVDAFRGMQVCASDRPGLAGQIEGEQIGRAVSAGNSVAIVFRAAGRAGWRRGGVVAASALGDEAVDGFGAVEGVLVGVVKD